MSSKKSSYPSPKTTSISLIDFSAEDKDLFAAAIYRPLEIWIEPSAPEELYLLNDAKKNEKEKIRALPSYLLQKQTRLQAILSNKPHPKGFCKTHDALHPYIIGSILHKVRHEVTGPQFNMLVPLQHPIAKSLACSLRDINAYWTTPHDQLKAFSNTTRIPSLRSVVFQENRCDACILAAISGNTEVLEALRTSSFSKKRAGGRLVGWLDRWLSMRGSGVKYEVQGRSEKNAYILRKLKSGNIGTKNKEDEVEGRGDTTIFDDMNVGEVVEGEVVESSYWSPETSEDEDGVVGLHNTNPKTDNYPPGWI